MKMTQKKKVVTLIAVGLILALIGRSGGFPRVAPFICVLLWGVSVAFVIVVRQGGHFEDLQEGLPELNINPELEKALLSIALCLIPVGVVIEGFAAVARVHGLKPGLIYFFVMLAITCIVLAVIYRRKPEPAQVPKPQQVRTAKPKQARAAAAAQAATPTPEQARTAAPEQAQVKPTNLPKEV